MSNISIFIFICCCVVLSIYAYRQDDLLRHNVGKRIVLGNDTLQILYYNSDHMGYGLSNGQFIGKELINDSMYCK